MSLPGGVVECGVFKGITDAFSSVTSYFERYGESAKLNVEERSQYLDKSLRDNRS